MQLIVLDQANFGILIEIFCVMKNKFIIASFLNIFCASFVYAQSCRDMFADSAVTEKKASFVKALPMRSTQVEKLSSKSVRVELRKSSNPEVSEKLFIESSSLDKDISKAAVELGLMLVANSYESFALNIPAHEGQNFLVTYKLSSNGRHQFVADQVFLNSETGGSRKLVDRIQNSSFDMGSILGQGVNAKIKIPFVIDGRVLRQMQSLSATINELKSMPELKMDYQDRKAQYKGSLKLRSEMMEARIGASGSLEVNGQPLSEFGHYIGVFLRDGTMLIADRKDYFHYMVVAEHDQVVSAFEIFGFRQKMKSHKFWINNQSGTFRPSYESFLQVIRLWGTLHQAPESLWNDFKFMQYKN
jgi:hypothetical protein